MKLTNKVCATLLIASIGASALAPSALAAPEWSGEGTVKFEKGETVIPPIVDPTDPDKEIEIPTNPDESDLKILNVTDLDFGSRKIDSGTEQDYPASSYQAKVKDSEETVPMAHFVRFQDMRTDGVKNQYTLSAKITDQFATTHGNGNTTTLDGATLTYSNMNITSTTHDAVKPAVTNQSVVIDAENPTPVLVQSAEDKGQGIFSLNFGTYDADEAADTSADSVNLKVPGTTLVNEGTYKSTVTWFIEAAK